MRHRYEMRYGAQVAPGGGSVRFSIWAPGRQSGKVKLLRDGGDILLDMEKQADGWFTLTTDKAQPGALYFYDFGDGLDYPDPASRRQPRGVHGPSEVVDALAYEWQQDGWRGRPWVETIIYELHVGTFTPAGTFAATHEKLDYLRDIGVTAIELMPLAQGPGNRGWGYDGVYVYAPELAYGAPDDLKRLIDAIHARGMMVFLDVVYNHLGPEGNYVGLYAPDFFTAKHHTPWGVGINFDQKNNAPVREFYGDNALYWLEEYRFDGLRCDAVHAIKDDSRVHIFEDIAQRVSDLAWRQDRHIHMIAENEDNVAHLLARDEAGRPRRFTAQWNDDFHHCLHVLLTGETDAFFVDYAKHAHRMLARCLTEGFAFQGERSAFRHGKRRGEHSDSLPLTAFINFLQNHDQAGNRPLGERLAALAAPEKLRAAVAMLLLSPAPPMLFMGEEWGATEPFTYFCDFGPELSEMVRTNRIKEFAIAKKFHSEAARASIPDPTDERTFASAKLDWTAPGREPHRSWHVWYKLLLTVRQREIVPLLDRLHTGKAAARVKGTALNVTWPYDGGTLAMTANLGDKPHRGFRRLPWESTLFSTHPETTGQSLPPWSVMVGLRIN